MTQAELTQGGLDSRADLTSGRVDPLPYIHLLSVARGHPPLHCDNTQVLREAITEDDDDEALATIVLCNVLILPQICVPISCFAIISLGKRELVVLLLF